MRSVIAAAFVYLVVSAPQTPPYTVSNPQTVDINAPQNYSVKAPKVCPPPELRSVTDLDLDHFISSPWYSVYQEVNTYQPLEQLYCVAANYSRHDDEANHPSHLAWGWMKSVFKFLRYGPTIAELNVENICKNGSVTANDTNRAYLRGVALDNSQPGNLLVGPKALPRRFYGSYNVIAIDPAYQWAVISGGYPHLKNSSTGYCQTGSNNKTFNAFTNNGNGQGLWFFSRTPSSTQNDIATMFQLAKNIGFETGRMIQVQQDGCDYKF